MGEYLYLRRYFLTWHLMSKKKAVFPIRSHNPSSCYPFLDCGSNIILDKIREYCNIVKQNGKSKVLALHFVWKIHLVMIVLFS